MFVSTAKNGVGPAKLIDAMLLTVGGILIGLNRPANVQKYQSSERTPPMRKQIVISLIIITLILTTVACNSLDIFQLLGILNGGGADTWDAIIEATQMALP